MSDIKKLNDTLIIIAEKLTILSMPEELREKQRIYFDIIKRKKRFIIYHIEAKQEYADDPTEENKLQMEKIKKHLDSLYEKYFELRNLGCEDITND